MILITAYLWICLAIFLFVIGFFIYEDICCKFHLMGRHGPDHKLGYNFQNPLAYFIVCFVSCPFVNLVVLYYFIKSWKYYFGQKSIT